MLCSAAPAGKRVKRYLPGNVVLIPPGARTPCNKEFRQPHLYSAEMPVRGWWGWEIIPAFVCWGLGWLDFQGKTSKMLLDLPIYVKGFPWEGAAPSPKSSLTPHKKPDHTIQTQPAGRNSPWVSAELGFPPPCLALNSKFSGTAQGHGQFSSWVILVGSAAALPAHEGCCCLWSLDGSLGFPSLSKTLS